MAMTIRQLQPHDYSEWLPLWHAYLTFYESSLTPEQTELSWQRLLDADFNLHGLVALKDGAVVGFTHYLFHPATWSAGDYCYLEDLFVLPSERGTGAGRALIEAVHQAAAQAGAAKVYWLTQTHNATARQLYDRVASDTGFMHYQIKL